MTRTPRMIALVIALTLPVLAGACAQTKTSDSTGQYVDDAAITAKVKTAILEDSDLKVFEIKVDTHRQVVQLSGFVDNRRMIARAGDVARHVSGVVDVQNDLILK